MTFTCDSCGAELKETAHGKPIRFWIQVLMNGATAMVQLDHGNWCRSCAESQVHEKLGIKQDVASVNTVAC